MQADQPLAQGVSSSVTNPEEPAEAIIVTRLKFERTSSEPARRAITSLHAQAITEFWRVHTKLSDADLISYPNVIEEVSVAIIHSFDVTRKHSQGEAEKK